MIQHVFAPIGFQGYTGHIISWACCLSYSVRPSMFGEITMVISYKPVTLRVDLSGADLAIWHRADLSMIFHKYMRKASIESSPSQ